MFRKWPLGKRHAWLRYGILIAVLAYTSWQAWSHGLGNKAFPSIHGLCPFGGVESLLTYLQNGSTLPKIFSGTMALLFTVVIMGIFFRRAFCGLICPMGTLQEAFGRLGGKVFGKRLEIPNHIDAPLRAIKYLVLLFSVAFAWATGTLWFQIIDPWAAYGHLVKWDDLMGTYLVGFIILVASLVGSFLVDRFFCKYLCPMGALTAIIGKFGWMRIHRRRREESEFSGDGPATGEEPAPVVASGTCIDCGICTRRCPVNIRVHEQEVVKQSECIDCGRCVAACPVPGALEHRFFGKRVSVVAVLILSIALYFGAIFAMQAFGFDRYSGGTEATLRELAKQSGISTGDFKKEYGLPATLSDRTGMTEVQRLIPISVVARQNGMSTSELKELFKLSPDLPDSTAWEPTLDTVSAEVFAASMGMDFDAFRASYGLDDTITPETPFREVRLKLEAASAEAASTESCGAEGGTGCTED